MGGREAQHRLAGVLRRGMRAVARFGTQHLDVRGGVGWQPQPGQHGRGALHNGRTSAPGLGHRVKAHDGELGRGLEARHVGGADLVAVGGRAAECPAHRHPVLAGLRQRDLREITHHVGQDVAGRVANLVQHLLGDHCWRHQAAGAGRLGAGKAAVGAAFDDGVTDVGPARHRVPVGMQAASGLATAFDDVAGQAARRQGVVIRRGPAKLVHQHAQRHCRVHAATGDDHLGTGIQRGLDWQSTQIGVGGQHLRWQCRTALQLAHRVCGLAQLRQQRQHVVAQHHGNCQGHAQLGGQCCQCRSATLRVDATGIADHANAAVHHLTQHRFHGHRHKVGGIAELGLFQAGAGQDGHGEFGQVIEHQVVNLPAAHQLRRAQTAVAPKTGRTANANHAVWGWVVCHGAVTGRSKPVCAFRGTPAGLRQRLQSAQTGQSGSR